MKISIGVTDDNLLKTDEGYVSIKDILSDDYAPRYTKTKDCHYHWENEMVKVEDNVKIINLILTDYGSFKMTPDTWIYMKDGNVKQAKDITSRDMLYGMPYYHRLKYIINEGSADVYNLKREYTHNFYIWNKNFLGNYTGILVDNLNNERGKE